MSQPNPYTANVNRAKTKKWVEAKSYSYDGDDWGEVDDYDEYGGYDDPEPEPTPKPTGLRQRGQSASQVPQEAYDSRQDLYQSPLDSRQPYGNLSGPPQQQYGGRSFTNPQPQQNPPIVRTNSFNRDDERRAFSAGGAQQLLNDGTPAEYNAPPPQRQTTSAHDFQPGQPHNYPVQAQPGIARPPVHVQGRSSMEAPARYGEQAPFAGGNYRGGAQPDQARQPGTGSRTQSMTSNNSGLEFHNRRDFSPSAMPPPLQTRGSPSPHRPDSSSSSRHPPRKSSLGQESAPVVPIPTQAHPLPPARDAVDEDHTTRDRAGSGAGKPLPFVRPADIYKRMQEEKEKERQSQESSRPSMEGILGRPNEKPALLKSHDSESGQRLKPALDPVTERKSEYGMEGLNLGDQEKSGERPSTSSKSFNFPKRATNNSSSAPQSSLGPVLPDVSRVSGFGESFFGSTGSTGDDTRGSLLNFGNSSFSQPSHQEDQTPTESGLQHQPSLGFTSAVHQAFDKAEDQVPPTPSSTQGSSVWRSASGGTSTVSPIISRGPSTATDNWNSRLPGIDNVSTPMIPERPEESSSRPLSSDSLGTPTQVARKPSPSQKISPQEAEERPPSFIPGYRRNSDTPSPDNSPRRTPALETNRRLRQPQEVELAATTPTEPSLSADNTSQISEPESEEETTNRQPADAAIRHSQEQSVDTQSVHEKLVRSPDTTGPSTSPVYDHLRGRTDSSSSSKVRNLADRFETASRPGSAHSTTPRASILGVNAQRKDDLAPPRPLIDHKESFRPHLPGGWESSASIAPAAALKPPQAPATQLEVDQNTPIGKPTPNTTDISSPSTMDSSSAADDHPSSVTQIKDASEEAFAAVAAAGSALVGAFGAAVGMEHSDSNTKSTPKAFTNKQLPVQPSEDYNVPSSGRGALNPEAAKPHVPLVSDEASTAAPTPLAKNTPEERAEPSQNSDYFPSSPPGKNVESGAYAVDEPRQQLPALPLLNTDSGSEQYESDRLRKEIVRELTPMSASEPTTAETDYSNYQPTLSTNPSVTRPGHESGVLPKEYESYWNDANSDDERDDSQGELAEAESATTAERPEGAAVVVKPLQLSQDHDPVPPASAAPEARTQERPGMLPHRFSWEQPLQEFSAEAEPIQEQSAAPTSSFLKSAVYPEGHSFQRQLDPSDNYAASTVRTVTNAGTDESSNVPDKDLPVPEARIADRQHGMVDSEKELPNHPSGLEVAPPTVEKQHDDPLISGHADEWSTTSLQGPASERRQGQETESPRPEPSTLANPSPSAQIVDLPPMPPPANVQPKISAFREILALKSPTDRIRAYNETRDQFANLNTGLAHWLAATTNDLPEHGDLVTSSGRPVPNFQGHRLSPSRSKLGGLLPVGGQTSQQPYFQQYLNASPGQTSVQDGNAGSGVGGGSPQGFAPPGGAGGKLSSQQVQAKGKDLLHTAGVFGGKANVAAKGLFSKGKSKLRAASGNEKAISRLSPGLGHPSRGMQPEPPNVQSQVPAQAFADLRPSLTSSSPPAPSPKPHHSTQNIQDQSSPSTPSETPSVESFTQSQLGDDERSEESEPTHQDHPPRTTSLYLKYGLADLKSSQKVHHPVTIQNSTPPFLQETPPASSYAGSPKEINSPRSATSSSNRTPTQANFPNGSPSATLRLNWQDGVGKPSPWQEIREEAVNEAVVAHSDRTSQPNPRLSTQQPYSPENGAAIPTDRDTTGSNTPQKQSSGDSKSTIRNVRDGRELSEPSTTPSKPPGLSKGEQDLMSRAPARMSALAASEVSPSAADVQRGAAKPSRSRPVSSSRDSLGVPGASQDNQMRGSSFDGLPGGINHGISPSPVSLYRPTDREPFEQLGRTGPIHYGVEHDFVPDSDHERARSRSRSYSRTSTVTRSSQDSRRSREPSTDHTPPVQPSGEVPSQLYSGHISREKSPTPHVQAPEYQVEGVSSPIEWPSASSPRSRRGSRSSAFFKSLTLGSPSKGDEPPLPNAFDGHSGSSPVVSPGTGEKKGKRASILRSLTGNSGSGSASGRSKVNVTPTPMVPQHVQPTQAAPAIPPQVEDDEFPSRGNSRSAASKFGKRLQRSSTSGNKEQDTGKKKRFSGIGSLFGRNNPKRQSSSANTQTRPQQPLAAQSQQDDRYARHPPPSSQQMGSQLPNVDYHPPPPGGYYAPSPPRAHDTPSPTGRRLQRNGRSSSWIPDEPAYVQDASLRQRIDQRMSSPPQNPPQPRTSATFPRMTPQHSSTSVPRAATTRSKSREPLPERPVHESKSSGGSWTRFSQHGRSKSRQQQHRPSSETPQQATTYSSPPSSRNFQMSQQPYHDPMRSESPPPPPPPPKDDWHRARPRETTPSSSNARASQHSPLPSQPSSHPMSTQNRQSLPQLQTNVPNNKRQSTVASGKTMTPEEKRKSRQLEIERSTISPDWREESEEEPPVVMSATSFPGQLWQPEYAHWDGD